MALLKMKHDFGKVRNGTPNYRSDATNLECEYVNCRGVNLNVVRFEVFTAVTAKNSVFCDIRTTFLPHRKHITSPLQNPAG
jgi:hypothetical protein